MGLHDRYAWHDKYRNQIVLSVRNLTKTYRSAGEQVAVLRGVNLDVAAGERVALTGESGSGKSTLLHLIAGLDRADGGEIELADAPRLRSRRCRPGGVAARPAGPGVSAVQPDPEPECRGQSRVPVAHRRPSRCRLACRTGGAARARRLPETLSRAIVRRPAAAGRDRPRAGGEAAAAARRRAHRQSRRGDRRRSAGAGARPGRANRLRLPDGDPQRAAGRHARPPGQSPAPG